MSTTRRNTSQRLTLIILVLASLTAITLDYRGEVRHVIASVRSAARDAVSPIQRVLSDGLHPLGDFFSGAVNYGNAVRENEQLRSQLGIYRREALENEDAEHELQVLLGEQRLAYVQSLPTVLAQVISGPTSNFQVTFEIDRGRSSGVGVGMPVVAGAGLVGIVSSAGSSTSVVETISNPGASFGVRLGASGPVAVAEGEGAGYPLSVSDVTAETPVHVGEPVYSSGVTGAALPEGLPVGTVSSVSMPGGALQKTVLVTPVAPLSGLSYVTVLQWLPAP